MDSFYGGQPGSSIFIAKKYKSAEDLKNDFKDINNKDVRYGEYGVVDNIVNAEEHGNIYRRDPNGPHYMFNAAGPVNGSSPNVNICSIDELRAKIESFEGSDYDYVIYTIANSDNNSNFGYEINILGETSINGNKIPEIKILDGIGSNVFTHYSEMHDKPIQLTTLPDGVNDNIEYSWATFVKIVEGDSNDETFTSADVSNAVTYIGLKVPIEYNTFSIRYTNPKQLLGEDDEANMTLNEISPNGFYKKWSINLPLYNNFLYKNFRCISSNTLNKTFNRNDPAYKFNFYTPDGTLNATLASTTNSAVDTIIMQGGVPSDYLWRFSEEKNCLIPVKSDDEYFIKTAENEFGVKVVPSFFFLCDYEHITDEEYWMRYVDGWESNEMYWHDDGENPDLPHVEHLTVIVGDLPLSEEGTVIGSSFRGQGNDFVPKTIVDSWWN